jgi:hypothetical protein
MDQGCASPASIHYKLQAMFIIYQSKPWWYASLYKCISLLKKIYSIWTWKNDVHRSKRMVEESNIFHVTSMS